MSFQVIRATDGVSFEQMLGRTPGPEDQPPGTYSYKRRGGPFQAVRILWNGAEFEVLLNGQSMGAAPDLAEIDFILYHGPFHPISEERYAEILIAYGKAKPGTPLAAPDQPVNLRGSRPL